MNRERPFHPGWGWWGIVAVWWTLDGLVDASQLQQMRLAAGEATRWSHALATSMASAWLWIPLTVLALWSAARFPLERARWRQHLLMHVLGAAAASLFRAVAVVVLNRWVGWYAELPGFPTVLLTSLSNNVFVYWLLVGVGHAVHFARTSRLREEQLAEARLQALKSQLHPHFLFNTMNAIVSFVRDDPGRAEHMILRLSELLRGSLEGAATQEVSLREELRGLEPYLEIEQARFGERLRVCWAVDPETFTARVPHLVLQPLVENAVRHGVTRRAGPGTIRISARREGERLRLEVRDDGAGLCAGDPLRKEGGVGIANLRARLHQLYGERGAFVLTEAPEGGAVGTVTVPFVAAEDRVRPSPEVEPLTGAAR